MSPVEIRIATEDERGGFNRVPVCRIATSSNETVVTISGGGGVNSERVLILDEKRSVGLMGTQVGLVKFSHVREKTE